MLRSIGTGMLRGKRALGRFSRAYEIGARVNRGRTVFREGRRSLCEFQPRTFGLRSAYEQCEIRS